MSCLPVNDITRTTKKYEHQDIDDVAAVASHRVQ
jgi:hypothetical protein